MTGRRGRPAAAASRGLKASRIRPNTALVRRLDPAVGRLLVTQRGQLAQQLLLPVVEPGRRLDVDGDDRRRRGPATAGGVRRGREMVCSVPDCVPGAISRSIQRSMSESASATSASSRGSLIVVPRAAAVIGTVTRLRRSVPSRVNTLCGATWISTYRSPAGPPPGPTSPSWASWTRVPVSTPGGIFTVIERRERTRPSPEHSRHGSGMISPYPRQAAHGRRVRISPRNERCTCCTSPRPRQVSQVTGRLPWAAPLPRQCCRARRCRP